MLALVHFLFRWRDVKMHAFDGADHRTYVDLKVILMNIMCSLFTIHIEPSTENFQNKIFSSNRNLFVLHFSALLGTKLPLICFCSIGHTESVVLLT
jgi:hypothetical protein